MLQATSVEEMKNTRFCSVPSFSKIVPLIDSVCQDTVALCRPQNTILPCTLNAGHLRLQNTHSEYVTIIAFPLQQRSHERASVLRHTTLLADLLLLLLLLSTDFI
jgi:hypothetical protein